MESPASVTNMRKQKQMRLSALSRQAGGVWSWPEKNTSKVCR